MEDELYTLNETGVAIWEALDGGKPLSAVVSLLVGQFDAAPERIETDVIGLLGELLKRKIVVERIAGHRE
jgi:hypothetical protein